MFSSAQTNGLPPTVTIGVGTACGIVIVILVVVIVYLSRRRRHSPGQLFRLLLRFCLFAFGNIIIQKKKRANNYKNTTFKRKKTKRRRRTGRTSHSNKSNSSNTKFHYMLRTPIVSMDTCFNTLLFLPPAAKDPLTASSWILTSCQPQGDLRTSQ